jgi:lipoprotein-releasing system ATP-binding protein
MNLSHTEGHLLSAVALKKSYRTQAGELPVLQGVDLSIDEGEVVAITGESGTGKSTLLHLLGALDRPTDGNIFYRGKDILTLGDSDLASFRNKSVGFVFQFHHLLPEFSAFENVAMPALIGGASLRSVSERVEVLLTELGVADRARHKPNQLSGGEQQRVAVARALINKPALVLMDEPTGNLDGRTADSLHAEILRLSREEGQTFVIVTHNPALAALADRQFLLERGTLET